jgi:transposase, IS5 family
MLVERYPVVAGGMTSFASNNTANLKSGPRAVVAAGDQDHGGLSSRTTSTIAHVCAETVAVLLDSREIIDFISELDFLKWTGRPGYSIRTLMGVVLTKSLFGETTWTRTLDLIQDHPKLRSAIGCEDDRDMPSKDAMYRFNKKLRRCEGQRQEAIDAVLEALRSKKPGTGENIAIDGSSIPAYANGQRFKSKGGRERSDDEFSDPDASWGHRSAISTQKGGGFYGYKLHMAVDATTDLPLAWEVSTGKDQESRFALSLLDEVIERGFSVNTAAMDKGYDIGPIYDGCEERNVRPIIPLRETGAVKKGDHKPPRCKHGIWQFAGADYKRGASKWRCPEGKCSPASVWKKADRLFPLVPRYTKRWKSLYCGRASVEREFGCLKNEWALTPLRVRRIERVKCHADMTILTKLAYELAKARENDGPRK